MNRRRLFVTLVILAAGLSHGARGTDAAAQAPGWDPTKVELSRENLQQLLTGYEQTAASTAYSGALREQARRNAEMIRSRLREGDFQTGDQIALVVEGEQALSNTFVVQAGPALVLPVIGRIPLNGVLRSELEGHLTRELGRYIRNPVVHARSSIRMMVSGGVGKEGFYVVPTLTVFPDVLMLAGGPVKGARLDEIRIERDGQTLWAGEGLQRAITEGQTLDQLGLRAGDRVVVPERAPGGTLSRVQTVLAIVSPLAFLISLFVRYR